MNQRQTNSHQPQRGTNRFATRFHSVVGFTFFRSGSLPGYPHTEPDKLSTLNVRFDTMRNQCERSPHHAVVITVVDVCGRRHSLCSDGYDFRCGAVRCVAILSGMSDIFHKVYIRAIARPHAADPFATVRKQSQRQRTVLLCARTMAIIYRLV